MASLYEILESTDEGSRSLAASRLREQVIAILYDALEISEKNQADLARRLGIRKSAVNQVLLGDGNLRVKTLAEYLHALGFELDVRLVEAGEPRRAELEDRPVRPYGAQVRDVIVTQASTASSASGESRSGSAFIFKEKQRNISGPFSVSSWMPRRAGISRNRSASARNVAKGGV